MFWILATAFVCLSGGFFAGAVWATLSSDAGEAEIEQDIATRTLRQKCVEKYGRDAVRIIDEDNDPTVPTARELDAQWGFNKTRKE